MTVKSAPAGGLDVAASDEEIRQLITDLRDAANDGRRLARRYAELLEKSSTNIASSSNNAPKRR